MAPKKKEEPKPAAAAPAPKPPEPERPKTPEFDPATVTVKQAIKLYICLVRQIRVF